MAFQVIDETSFRLEGMPSIYEDWDIECEVVCTDYYEDRLKERFDGWVRANGINTTDILAAKRQWFEHRLTETVRRKPEIQWIIDRTLNYQVDVFSFDPAAGSITIKMAKRDLVLFKLSFVQRGAA